MVRSIEPTSIEIEFKLGEFHKMNYLINKWRIYVFVQEKEGVVSLVIILGILQKSVDLKICETN